MVNSYFDFGNYDTPVQTYLDDRYRFEFAFAIEKTVTVYISQNEGEVLDNYIQYSPNGKQYNFVSVERISKEFRDSSDGNVLLTIKFVKDYNYNSYERQIFSVLDMFGNLGGVFEILSLIGELCVGIFAERLFNYSIVSTFYQVDTAGKEKERAKESSFDAIPVPQDENMHEEFKNDDIFNNAKVMDSDTDTRSKPLYSRAELKALAKQSMENRRFYNYSIGDYTYNLFCC